LIEVQESSLIVAIAARIFASWRAVTENLAPLRFAAQITLRL
jgi:hypothetical protein